MGGDVFYWAAGGAEEGSDEPGGDGCARELGKTGGETLQGAKGQEDAAQSDREGGGRSGCDRK